MGSRVRGVPVLERHEVAVVRGERTRHLDRAVRPLVAVGEDDLGAEQPEEAEPLLARVVRQDDGEAVALPLGDHRERDARVPRGRLEDRLVGRQLDRTPRRPRPSRARSGPSSSRSGCCPRASPTDARRASEDIARHADERRVPDRIEDVVVARHAPIIPARSIRPTRAPAPSRCRDVGVSITEARRCHRSERYRHRGEGRPYPPATAGRIETVSPSPTSVSKEPR